VVCLVDLSFLFTRGISIRIPEINQELMELSFIGDSCTDSMEGSNHVEIQCFEDPEGATEQFPRSHEASGTLASWKDFLSSSKPSSENLQVLAVSFGNLVSRVERRTVVALPRSGPGRLGHRDSCWGLPANISRAPASGQLDPEPANVQYIWAAHTRRGKTVEVRAQFVWV